MNKSIFADFVLFSFLGLAACWIVDFALAIGVFYLRIVPSSMWFPESRLAFYGLAFATLAAMLLRFKWSEWSLCGRLKAAAIIFAVGLACFGFVRVQQRTDAIPMFEFKKL